MTGLGVAPPSRPAQALTGRALTAALDRVLGDERFADAAIALGRLARAEDGLAAAVTHLERAARSASPVAIQA
jgi:UDP:flavonoid glycosyltransferase YjiC (YdhE family)